MKAKAPHIDMSSLLPALATLGHAKTKSQFSPKPGDGTNQKAPQAKRLCGKHIENRRCDFGRNHCSTGGRRKDSWRVAYVLRRNTAPPVDVISTPVTSKKNSCQEKEHCDVAEADDLVARFAVGSPEECEEYVSGDVEELYCADWCSSALFPTQVEDETLSSLPVETQMSFHGALKAKGAVPPSFLKYKLLMRTCAMISKMCPGATPRNIDEVGSNPLK